MTWGWRASPGYKIDNGTELTIALNKERHAHKWLYHEDRLRLKECKEPAFAELPGYSASLHRAKNHMARCTLGETNEQDALAKAFQGARCASFRVPGIPHTNEYLALGHKLGA